MDESHFEDTGARVFKYCFFTAMLVLTCVGFWQKDAILGYLSFREHGESRIVITAISGTKVSIVDSGNKKRELGLVGRDGKFTLVEKGNIRNVRINLEHPYYFPEERQFDLVEKGQVVRFDAVMVPLLGTLTVKTFPSGATVFVNDKEVGVSTYKERNLRDGKTLFVEARLPGYISQYRDITIEGGKDSEVVFSLVSSEAMISLETDKEGFAYNSLRIFIDGVSYALDGQSLRNVRPGRHKIEVVASDGLKLEKEINIKPGQTIHMKLPDWFVEDGS